MKKILVIATVTIIISVLSASQLFNITTFNNASDTNSNNTYELPPPDSDNDGYSDDFETNISKTDTLISNDCYFLSFSTIRNKWDNSEEKIFSDFLIKNKVPSANIVNLFSVNASKENLINSLAQLSEKTDENDILIVYIYSHGDANVFQPFKTGLMPEQVSTGNQPEINDIGGMEVWDTMTYSELDHCFDNIQSKILIVFDTCGNQDDSCFETLKGNNRILIAAYNKYGQLHQIMELVDDERTQAFNNTLSHCVFTEQPDQSTIEIPIYKWILENYDSINAIWNDIDQNGDGYISLYENISWIKKAETATVFKQSDKSYTFHEAYKISNLELLKNIYFPMCEPISP